MRCRLVLVSTLVVAAASAWGEWQNHQWSRKLVDHPLGRSEAIVVPGFKNPQRVANFVNRRRVRSALRSVVPGVETRLILCGGATSATVSEARIMADYAIETCGYTGELLLEEDSKTTWENITNVISMLEDVDRIKIASQPAHGLKARVYLRRQRPDLADKLARSADYRCGELVLMKPALAAYGLWTLRRVRAEALGRA